jgi:tetratricopeptide (TPR) repeat protein
MTRRLYAVALIAVALIGCRPDDQKTETMKTGDARAQLSATVVTQLDSGNAAFKRKDYQRARASYQAAVAADKDVAAGWFGLYMTEFALGNTAAADAALEKAQKLAPGATLIHPRPGRDSTRHP